MNFKMISFFKKIQIKILNIILNYSFKYNLFIEKAKESFNKSIYK